MGKEGRKEKGTLCITKSKSVKRAARPLKKTTYFTFNFGYGRTGRLIPSRSMFISLRANEKDVFERTEGKHPDCRYDEEAAAASLTREVESLHYVYTHFLLDEPLQRERR